MNTYDPEKHEYRINGKIVPSITQALPKPNFYMSPECLQMYADEGIENHAMIKMYFDTKDTFGDPMLQALDEWVKAHIDTFGEFRLCEKPLYSKKYLFAGTPDVIFGKCIIDFKRSPGNTKTHALQLAGQHLLAVENKIIPKTKFQFVAWYDGEKFKSRSVYIDNAEDVFIALVKKWYIDRTISQYFNK